MGRPRKFTPESLADAWEKYKKKCDAHTVLKTEFSQRNSQFVTAEIPAPITYTILGFCIDCNLARSKFYADYADNPRYGDIVMRMEAECEQDAREKFESGAIPTQLSGLWMSKHGYTTKTDTNVTGAMPVVISGGEDLED